MLEDVELLIIFTNATVVAPTKLPKQCDQRKIAKGL